VSEDSQHDAADAELARQVGDWLTTQVFDMELESVVIDDRFREMP